MAVWPTRHRLRLGLGAVVGGAEPVDPLVRARDRWRLHPKSRTGRGRARSSGHPRRLKAFEHRWALAEAFDFHQALGRDRVVERTRLQASQLKEGLADKAGVRVVTPSDPELSSGIVCLAMEDAAIFELPAVLREQHGVIASITPYNLPLLRLGPSIITSPDDVEAAIRAIDAVR